jgi:hypothetical protein
MKTLLAALLMLPAMAVSQETKRVDLPCASLDKIVEVTEKYDELPLLRSSSVRDGAVQVLVIYANMKTGSYTIVERVSDNWFCVLSVGADFQTVPVDIIEEIITERIKKRT